MTNIDNKILIDSLKYLPDFLQNKPLMKDAAKLLDACLCEDNDILKQIHEAYCDTLYKIAGYQQLSYGAKTELIKERGFEYLLDILKHIYEERYNQLDYQEQKQITLQDYLEKQTSDNLANITMLFNLLYILKGKTLGLELALQLVNCPEFIYITWDTISNYKGEWKSFETLPLPGGDVEVKKGDAYTVGTGAIAQDVIFNGVSWHKCTDYKNYASPRQQFTAELTIWGLASTSLQGKIAEFVRYYMLPYIEVSLEFTAHAGSVCCYPSGDTSLLHSYTLKHYYEEEQLIKKNLDHDVSQDHWQETGWSNEINIGQPEFGGKGFQGKVDLTDSFVQRGDKKFYLYGQTKTIPEIITGPALSTLTEQGTISFNNDYVQAPLQKDFVLVDIVTGDQINPHYEGDELIRDTIIRYNTCLLVEGIHLDKTIEEMNSLLIGDFDKYLDETEVYAGRVTDVHLESPSGSVLFKKSTPWVREKTGKEPTIHLQFSDAFVEDYTGIGDLGILGSNTYFIYNNMLFYNVKGAIKQIGVEETWQDIGASHAVSDTYYTPAICDNKLYYIKGEKVELVTRDKAAYENYTHHTQIIDMPVEVVDELPTEQLDRMILLDFTTYLDLGYWTDIEASSWTHVTGYVNEHYTAFGICDGYLYRIYLKDGKVQHTLADPDQGWTYITGSLYSGTYEGYGIKNGVLHTLGDAIFPVKYNDEVLSGWDSSFDCISRYHHNNEQYITYGVCNGNLYYLQNDIVGLLDEGGWSAVCGFYNDASPRTFAYAIKNEALYELRGKEFNLTDNLKDNTRKWTDISGCTTSTNTFVLGIADKNVYKINAKTLEPINEDGDWTDVFGRLCTSTTKTNNCYGYGIKSGRLVILNRDTEFVVPGMWKKDGIGEPVDLHNYNIDDIAVKLEDGSYIEGIENVRISVPVADEPASDYDIYVTYETLGFENNHRYQIKTEMSDLYNIYINPADCRYDVFMDKAPEFETDTSLIRNFTVCPLIIHGEPNITGEGDAHNFSNENYLEIQEYFTEINEEFESFLVKLPIDEAVFHVNVVITDELKPIILDKDGVSGIYYGYEPNLLRYGLFAKSDLGYTKLLSVAKDDTADAYIKYQNQGQTYAIYVNDTLIDVPGVIGEPKFLGGNSQEFGNCSILLLDSYLYTDKHIPLYENGKYFSVDTLQQDLVERIITPDKQECQKIIEIQDSNRERIIDLEMDSMYVSRTFDCTNSDLSVKDDYCLDKLHYGEREGITTSTLVYSGEYTLDPTKAQDVGGIKNQSDYGLHAVASKFNVNDYIKVLPTSDLVLTTGNNVENQILFQTEEGVAYTNKYLLTAESFVEHIRNVAHAVPSGIIFDSCTNKPGTVERSLEYNAESFEINEELIKDTHLFGFNPYTAILSGFTNSGFGLRRPDDDTENEDGVVSEDDIENGLAPDMYCTIPLEMDLVESAEWDSYDVLPILKVKTSDSFKQKIGQIAFEDIIIGNKEYKYFDRDGNEIDGPIYPEYDEDEDNENIELLAEDEEAGQEGSGQDPTDPEQNPEDPELPTEDEGPLYTEEVVVDENCYPYEDNTDYYLKFDIKRQSRGIQNITLQETTSTEEKDKFIFVDGVISNFSTENYLKTTNLLSKYGLQICYIADDDVSKDQGLFGVPNAQSICIKDNRFTLCGEDGKILEQAETDLVDNEKFYLLISSSKFSEDEEGNIIEEPALLNDEAFVYLMEPEDNWMQQLFVMPIKIQDEMYIGYANTSNDMMSFNGAVDLTRSYTLTQDLQPERLYDFTQITTVYASTDNEHYEVSQVIKTPYPDDTLFFGYKFNGELDMYGSITSTDYGFLLPYTLGWVEDGVWIDTIIKQQLATLDPTYDPDLDTNKYGIEEYGIHLEDEPQRWDYLTVTYETQDNAYYMEPNTTYYLSCSVELDENGKCLLEKVGDPSWNSGVVTCDNGYYTTNFDVNYMVIDCTTKGIEDQILCGYTDDNSQAIVIKDGKWQFFDDVNYHVICDAKENTQYVFKLCADGNIECNNEDTGISAIFSNYDTFIIGKQFNGTINFNTSYTVTDKINYFFTLYKRVMPYISTNKVDWNPITLEPLLTLDDMIAFGQGFSGSLELDKSDLLLDGATYWTANQINIYALEDMPEDDIKANDLVRSILIDSTQIDTSKFWYDEEKVKVNMEENRLTVTGKPIIGDVITLTYNTWYLFRELNKEYDFKITYTDKATVSYTDGENEYVIYQMKNDSHIINTGYNFWGSLSVKDSYRGGMRLCDYIEYRTYVITYKKHEETEWTKWSQFSVESRYLVYVRTGFELGGPLFMESSYVRIGSLTSPFLAYWDSTYIGVVGGVNVEKGIATLFSNEDYLQMKMANLQDGDMVEFKIQFNDIPNQGIGTQLYLQNGYVTSNNLKLQKVYKNYKAIVQYFVENGKARARIIGNNTTNFNLAKSDAYTLTLIPFNELLGDTQIGHYVKSSDDAEKLSVYYRVGDTNYDHFTPPVKDWAYAPLELTNVRYFGQDLNDIYVAKIPLGYTYDKAGNAINTNPNNVAYLKGQVIEYKIVNKNGLTTYNKTMLYNNRLEKQKTRF